MKAWDQKETTFPLYIGESMNTLKHFTTNSHFLHNLGVTDLKNKLSTKEIKHFLHVGGQNYKNLKEKVPILGENGKPLRFRAGGKTVLEMFEPLYKAEYKPPVGTEYLFARPGFMKISTQRRRGNGRRSNRKQMGGMDALGVLSLIGIGIYSLLQFSSVFSSGSSNSNQETSTAAALPQNP